MLNTHFAEVNLSEVIEQLRLVKRELIKGQSSQEITNNKDFNEISKISATLKIIKEQLNSM